MNVFEYLVSQEEKDGNFHFGVGKNWSLFICYPGYKHMNLLEIEKILRKKYKLKYDFEQGLSEFDRVCGKTFIYFKDVYKNIEK